MNASSISDLFFRLSAGVRALAHEAILIFTISEGALLQTILIMSVGVGAGLLKAWCPATLANNA
jgi:hypothetical protein